MKHLRLYENFQTEEQIAKVCRKYDIKNWSINSEGLVDVDGNVILYNKGLDKIPLKFGKVTGKFDCGVNKLTSLDGAPKQVGDYFSCEKNQLASLEGSPKQVGGNFYCYSNKLTSLEGSPKYIGGDFDCAYNNLTSLEGCPIKIGGYFYCFENRLTSLRCSPKHVGGHFDCSNNKLDSFEGAPDFIGGVFICEYNPISRIWKLFEDYSKIELFNYYDIVRELDGKPAIVLARLNQFLDDIGKPSVEKVEGYTNI